MWSHPERIAWPPVMGMNCPQGPKYPRDLHCGPLDSSGTVDAPTAPSRVERATRIHGPKRLVAAIPSVVWRRPGPCSLLLDVTRLALVPQTRRSRKSTSRCFHGAGARRKPDGTKETSRFPVDASTVRRGCWIPHLRRFTSGSAAIVHPADQVASLTRSDRS